MKQVNLIIRANTKNNSKTKNVIKSTRGHLSYLKRQTDVFEFYSNGLTETQFVQLLNGRYPYRLVVSPAKKCDMKALIDETIKTLCKYNNVRKLQYLSYIHYDTTHVHAHIIILPPRKKKDFKASGRFIQEAIYPDLNKYLENIFGKSSEAEIKEEYKNSIKNIGQSKVDYDIKRLCDSKKEFYFDNFGQKKVRTTYIYNKNHECRVEDWKIKSIHERINILVSEGIGSYDKKSDVISFDENFIFKKIVRGKIVKHIATLPKSLDVNSIILRKTPEREIVEVLSSVINKEKHTISRVVKTLAGTIELNEKKIRKDLKIKLSNPSTSEITYSDSLYKGI